MKHLYLLGLLSLLLIACTLSARAASTIALSALPASSGAVGQRIVLSAALTGVPNARYRFEVRDAGSTATYTRDWSTARSTWWYPAAEGTYTARALARSGTAGTPIEASITYLVKPKLSAVSLDCTVGAATAVNTRLTFTATATGGGTVEYRPLIGYRAGTSGAITWDQTRPYGLGRSTTFTPGSIGSYWLRVYAREKGSAAYYDVASPDLRLTLKAAVTDFGVTFAPSAAGRVGSTITITGTNAVGGGTLEWKAWAKLKTTSTWTVVRDYAIAPAMPWTPLMAGEYDLMVYAREVGRTSVGYDVRKVGLTYTVLPLQPGDTKVDPITGSVLVYVPAGEFLMGVPTDATYEHSADQHPQRRVNLDAYWIMRDAVTVAEYRAFCTATMRGMPSAPAWGWHDDHPIVNVTWNNAKAYADWAGLALPTEAQREKAARGTDARLYPWGNTWDAARCANWTNSELAHGGLSTSGTWPVGSFPMGNSPYGCRDMAGNVYEWCADWHGDYDPAAIDNPTGPPSGDFRILRGGSWKFGHEGLFTTAARGGDYPYALSNDFGFRCVAAASPNGILLAQAVDGKLALMGDAAALPAGVTPANITLTPRTAAEVPAVPAGCTLLAAVECGPSGTVFTSPVTLRFTLTSPPAAGNNLVLYMLVDDDQNAATPSVWQMVGGGVTVVGNVASVQVTHFSTFGLFVTANAVLPGDKYFRFDGGVYDGGMPSHVMYNDTNGTLMLPHAQLLPVAVSYDAITTAPYGAYRDSNGGASGGYFPVATPGAVFVARVTPMGGGEDTYYKMQVVARTLRPSVESTDYGVLTFKYARILPPAHVSIDGDWSFPGGASLTAFPGGTSFDLRPVGIQVVVVSGAYTSANTLVGTFERSDTSETGTVTATFARVGATLNATFVTSGTLGTVTLTGGTR